MIEVTLRDGDQWITIQADTIDEAIRRIHTVVNDAVAQLNTQLKEHVHDRQT